jgi:anti-anti-sigma factor
VTRSKSSCAQFGIDFDYDVGNTTVSIHGELDALSVPAFNGALLALAERGIRFVTIDLSELRFCSVGGLRAMAELAARLNAVDGRVAILAPAILTRMLDMRDLQSLFVVGDPPTTTAASTADPDLAINRAPRSSRPRASSLHRLPTGGQ